MPRAVSLAARGYDIHAEPAERIRGGRGLRGEEHIALCRLCAYLAEDIRHRAEAVRDRAAELIGFLCRARRRNAACKNAVEILCYRRSFRALGAKLRAEFC